MATSTLGSGTLVLAGTTSGTTTVTATAVAGTTTLTLPAATDTLVGKATTDTLTNKTLTGAAMNGTVGATTPSTGAFTTLSSTGNVTVGNTSGERIVSIISTDNNSFYKVAPGNGATGGYRFNNSAGTQHWNIFQTTGASGQQGNLGIYNEVGASQVLTLDTSGNLLVGRTTSSQTTNGIEISPKFGGTANNPVLSIGTGQAGGTPIILYSTTASAYRFYVEGTGQINATFTSITAISDQRLKENIRDLDDGLTSVMALKPRKFDWKEGKGQNIKNARGFIAQEFENVFPDMIKEWLDPAPEGEKPYKAINANLIPTLVKAIQEQQALIIQLTARITALESA